MLSEPKRRQALRALQLILARARWIAAEAGHSELATLLDDVEVLPALISDAEDRATEIAVILSSIAEKFPACSHASRLFEECGE